MEITAKAKVRFTLRESQCLVLLLGGKNNPRGRTYFKPLTAYGWFLLEQY